MILYYKHKVIKKILHFLIVIKTYMIAKLHNKKKHLNLLKVKAKVNTIAKIKNKKNHNKNNK